MNYKILGNNDFMFNLLETIGKNREVDNINDLINTNISNTYSYKLLDSIDKAVNCIVKHITNNDNIHIIVDSDADGNTSAATMYNYLSLIYDKDKITWHVHPGKQHGIILDELKEYNFDLLISPDGGSNDFKEHAELYEQGKEIIVLDHHEADIPDLSKTTAIIVNNKACDYPNKEFSGAGIVYKFCQALDDYFKVKFADNFLDLVALGNISDMMDSRSLETRYFMTKGLEKINNKFFQSMIDKQSFKISRLNMIGISFYIAPLINAVNRVGTIEERKNLFNAFIDTEIKVDYKKRGEKESKKVYLYEDMARQTVNIKARQDRIKTKLSGIAIDKINNEQLNNNKILFINMEKLEQKEFTGLIANDIASKYQKPVIILREKEQKNKEEAILTGSARNYDKHEIKNLKTVVNDSNLFELAEGHQGAFGIRIKPDNLSLAIEYFNKELKDIEDEIVYYIDFSFDSKELDRKTIKQFDKLMDMYGQNFKEPFILVKGVNVNTQDIYVNDKKSILVFKDKGIKYCMFFPSEEICDKLSQGENLDLNVIGRASINNYRNEETYQVVMEDFEIMKKNTEKKFWF